MSRFPKFVEFVSFLDPTLEPWQRELLKAIAAHRGPVIVERHNSGLPGRMTSREMKRFRKRTEREGRART